MLLPKQKHCHILEIGEIGFGHEEVLYRKFLNNLASLQVDCRATNLDAIVELAI